MTQSKRRLYERDSSLRKLINTHKKEFLMSDSGRNMCNQNIRFFKNKLFTVRKLIDALHTEIVAKRDYWPNKQLLLEAEHRERWYEYQINIFERYKTLYKNKKKEYDVEELKTVSIGEIMKAIPSSETRERAMYKCPLHNDDTPSFVWYKQNNSFYCFGCGEGGDNISLLMKRDECTFVQALQQLEKIC